MRDKKDRTGIVQYLVVNHGNCPFPSPRPKVWPAYRDSAIDQTKHIQHGENTKINIKMRYEASYAHDPDSSVVFSF